MSSNSDLHSGLQTPIVDLDLDGEAQIPLDVSQKLQGSLSELGRGGGITGWIADTLLSAGDWVEKEFEERRQMIGGIDNLWLLLTNTADFNPVLLFFDRIYVADTESFVY